MFRFALLALATLIAWIVSAWVGSHHLFAGSALPDLVRLTAGALTALLTALALVGFTLEIGLRQTLRIEPVGAQRVVIFIIVTFAVTAIGLKLMGFDITTILTTSALLTAIIGFALQPTLGGLFSGIALQLDSHLKPGDGIRYKGENVKIESMNWRSVVGRKRDDTLIIIPNSSLAGEPVEIYPNDRPIWSICTFSAPASWPPQRVSDIARCAVADLDFIDATAPVMVHPQLEDIPEGRLEYRIRYKAAYYFETPELDCEVLRRLWYCFQREGIPLAASRLLPAALRERRIDAAVWPDGASYETAIDALASRSGQVLTAQQKARLCALLADHAAPLLFGPNERIALPAASKATHLLLAAGALHRQERSFAERRLTGDAPPASLQRHYYQRLSAPAELQHLAVLLADHIGPYARQAVEQAAHSASSMDHVITLCAEQIDKSEARAEFLRAAGAHRVSTLEPGHVMTTRSDVAGQILAVPACRAFDEAVFLALDPEVVTAFDALSPHLLAQGS